MSKYKIVQISDPHLTADGDQPAHHQKIDPFLKLNTIFMDISNMIQKPDLIVITGDIVHEGKTEDYQKIVKLLQRQMDSLDVPIEVIMGNHDRINSFFDGFLKEPRRKKYYFSIEKPDLTMFFLDTAHNGLEAGYLGTDQLTWLSDNLQDCRAKTSIIFMHHPMDGPGLHHMRYSILQESSEFLEVIKNTSVKGVFAGHIHFETNFSKDNILFHTADSAAYHINSSNSHKHLIYDGTSYDIITVEDSEIGIESRFLYVGQDVISSIDVPDTGFVDRNMFR